MHSRNLNQVKIRQIPYLSIFYVGNYNLGQKYSVLFLTEVAGEGGTDCPPQKFLSSQKFRHLMRCKKYLENFFYLA